MSHHMQPSSSGKTSASRPSSSLSNHPPRPSSSLSAKSLSGRTPRTTSSSQAKRLRPLIKSLVTQLTNLDADGDEYEFQAACERVNKGIGNTIKAGVTASLGDIDKQIAGHSKKMKVHSFDTVANVLEERYSKLKSNMSYSAEQEIDSSITLSHLPSHLKFILLLSDPPAPSTTTYATLLQERLKNPPQSPKLTWAQILAEEPLEGQHWQGAYGLPAGSTKENWDGISDSSSTPPLSALGLEDSDDSLSDWHIDDDSVAVPMPPTVRLQSEDRVEATITPTAAESRLATALRSAAEAEDLRSRQYWGDQWQTDVIMRKPFDMGDASTLGPLFRQASSSKTGALLPQKYINEEDAYREILIGLQNRKNILINWSEEFSAYSLSENAPSLLHLTPASQSSIFTSFAQIATVVTRVRNFTSAIFKQAFHTDSPQLIIGSRKLTRTMEAFAEAIDNEVRAFDAWCASREDAFCLARSGVGGAPHVISLLNLEKVIRDSFGDTFHELLCIAQHVMQRISRSKRDEQQPSIVVSSPLRVSPAVSATILLDTILAAVKERTMMADEVTAASLMRVLICTVEPMWDMIGSWLRNGACSEHVEAEFFVEDNELPLTDLDFWSEGYILREDSEQDYNLTSLDDVTRTTAIPEFIRESHVAEMILAAGKAIGLLRSLGIEPVTDPVLRQNWKSFSEFLVEQGFGNQGRSFMLISTDLLSRSINEELQSVCEPVGIQLSEVLVSDGDLWRHLESLEDLYFMRRGDIIGQFVDILFMKMDTDQGWTDFHFLNAAFSDTVRTLSSGQNWIDPTLVRFSYRRSRERGYGVSKTVTAINGLTLEYAIPFPLTFLFGPRSLRVYGAVFVFLLQIQRVKTLLERISLKAFATLPNEGNALKAIWAMRSKLHWFINTLLNFLTLNVIHAQLADFHESFRKAQSLDAMIMIHEAHLDKIEEQAFVKPDSPQITSLQQAILSILDIGLRFMAYYTSFAASGSAADATSVSIRHDLSRRSIDIRRHRSRRYRMQQKNVIGFFPSVASSLASTSSRVTELEPSSESGDDDDEDDETGGDKISADPRQVTFTMQEGNSRVTDDEGDGDDEQTQLQKMSVDLDNLVRFVRRSVEKIMASGAAENATAYNIFAFALEDWDS